jgi:hypothetical protein
MQPLHAKVYMLTQRSQFLLLFHIIVCSPLHAKVSTQEVLAQQNLTKQSLDVDLILVLLLTGIE